MCSQVWSNLNTTSIQSLKTQQYPIPSQYPRCLTIFLWQKVQEELNRMEKSVWKNQMNGVQVWLQLQSLQNQQEKCASVWT